MTRSPRDPRLDALLADAALFGLTAEERAELLQSDHADDVTYELAAAAADLATLQHEAIPADVLARLERSVAPQPVLARAVAPTSRSAAYGWMAAAACLLLAVGGWWSYATKAVPPVVVERIIPAPSVVPPEKDLATQRSELLARAGDAVTRVWSPTHDASGTGVSGDVVWSAAEQRGFMRFRGLAANDRATVEYQLWIFDEAQEHPVDGGVFDISATGEVIVPIVAKLHVREPKLFAVTVEKPGGVVVSKKEHVVVTAAMKPG